MEHKVQTVWKYPLSFDRDVRIAMPIGARVVRAGLDGLGQPCLWALVDPNAPKSDEQLYAIHGTGGQVPDFKDYVATFITLPFVWHVFVGEPK